MKYWRSIIVNQEGWTYKVGHTFVVARKGNRKDTTKILAKHYEVLGMTEQDCNQLLRGPITGCCKSCDDGHPRREALEEKFGFAYFEVKPSDVAAWIKRSHYGQVSEAKRSMGR